MMWPLAWVYSLHEKKIVLDGFAFDMFVKKQIFWRYQAISCIKKDPLTHIGITRTKRIGKSDIFIAQIYSYPLYKTN